MDNKFSRRRARQQIMDQLSRQRRQPDIPLQEELRQDETVFKPPPTIQQDIDGKLDEAKFDSAITYSTDDDKIILNYPVYTKGPHFDVVAYGAKADGTTDDSAAFDSAIAAATASGGVVLVSKSGTYKLSDDVTIPSDVTLLILQDCILSVDTTKTLALAARSGFSAGAYKVFAGAGSVTFGKGVCEYVLPQWWGAVGDDSTDCVDAFNSALGAAASIGTILVLTGTYRVTTPICEWPTTNSFAAQGAGIILRGAGKGDAVIKYMGSSGYAIEIRPASQFDTNIVCGHTIEDIHVQAASVTDIDTGGAILANGSNHTLNGICVTNCDDGTAFAFIGRDVSQEEDGMTHDTDNDLTSTGAGASEKYAFKFTTGAVARLVHSVTATLGKTGAPAGTGWWEIWTDVAGAPGVQTGGDSESITLTDLSAAAGGAAVKTLFGDTYSPPTLSASTVYWAVFQTTGYTYADGVTEVRLRVDAGDGVADSFATFTWGGAWATSDDGLNNVVEIRYGQGINHRMNDCFTYGPTDKVGRAVRIEDGAILQMTGCFLASQLGFYYKRADALLLIGYYGYVDDKLIEAHGSGWITFGPGCWLEGGSVDSSYDGMMGVSFNGPVIGGGKYTVGNKTMVTMAGGEREPHMGSYAPQIMSDYWEHRVITPLNGKWDVSATARTATADADSLMGYCHQLDTQNEAVGLAVYPDSSNPGIYHFGQLPAGTYRVTIWAKDANQVANDLRVQIRTRNGSGWANGTLTKYTLTADYKPYLAYIIVDETAFSGATPTRHGNQVYLYKYTATVNTISISHMVVERRGTDELFRDDAICYNTESSDADGARVSRVEFIGRQSGTEISALASLTASHDGAADDQKGKLEIGVNDGDDLMDPTTLITLNSDLSTDIGGAANYTTMEADGTVKFNGTATVWDDLRVPGQSVQKGASAPDLAAFLGAGSLLVNRFDGGVTMEQVYFTIQLPHSYKEGSDVTPHVHWTPVDANSGNVKWQLEYSWANIDGTHPAVTTINAVDAADGTAWKHQRADFSVISGTGKTMSSMIVCRLFRDPTDDTYGTDAAFLEFDVHFEIDTVGSRQILIK